LLTGATGLVGRYLLRELLLRGRPTAVLARDARQGSAAERVAELIAFWEEALGRRLPTPVVLAGELGPDGPGLAAAERRWLGRHCRAVLHAAASLAFRETPEGEPWRTNVAGTQALLRLCQEVGLAQWHQVSTAFVCGRRTGVIAEEDHDPCPSFHNPYEASKYQAEQLLRRTPGLRTTTYRPSVIVGDSRTGYTSSFTGLYRFVELAVRLAAGDTALPLRLPLSGDEPWNLVPVDWVARAVVQLLGKPSWHGHTFHLVSPAPVPTRLIRDVGARELNLRGVELCGPGGVAGPSRWEELFQGGIREYWPYLKGTPTFAFANTAAALPHLPAPVIDRPLLARLIRFAVQNRWGHGQAVAAEPARPPAAFCCAGYIEQTFPAQARRSRLAHEVGLDLTVGIDVRGAGGGQWACKWVAGELVYVKRGLPEQPAVTYRTDPATFEAVVHGRQTPQEAFFEQRIALTGDVETGLKLAVLFGQFLAENPPARPHRTEVMDSTASPP
jgi:thioester reductase-like protein